MQTRKFGVFDLDGTLLDSMTEYLRLVAEILQTNHGLSQADVVKYSAKMNGLSIPMCFEKILVAEGLSSEKALEDAKEFWRRARASEFSLLNGAREVVEELSARGVQLFVSLGSDTSEVKKHLARHGLLDKFVLTYGSSEIPKSEKHLNDFVEAAGVTREEFSAQGFFVGDGPHDMHLGKAFGLRTVGLPQTFGEATIKDAGAEVMIESLTELLNVRFGGKDGGSTVV